jgi:aspartyl-tRNA(Asn)/glutamyl-tRNA(Gln) amidotransferase subunit B
LGTKVELKNINSFGMIKRAIEHEIQRQTALLERNESIMQETRRRDDSKGESFSMRSKADAIDYRYVPEPDIPPLHIPSTMIEQISKQLKEPVSTKIERFRSTYQFNKEIINALITDLETLAFFEECVSESFDPKMIAKRIA